MDLRNAQGERALLGTNVCVPGCLKVLRKLGYRWIKNSGWEEGTRWGLHKFKRAKSADSNTGVATISLN